MKRLCLSVACLIFVGLPLSDAVANVTVISETHHVWGIAWSYTEGDYTVLDQYDQQADSPLSGSAYYADWLYSYSNTGLLQVEAGSNAHRGLSSMDYVWSGGYAESTWLFQPHKSSLSLEIDVFGYPSSGGSGGIYYDDIIYIHLEDTTSGDELFHFDGKAYELPDYMFRTEPLVELFTIDPTHTYCLDLYLESTANHDGPWDGSISVAVIPAPSAILLGSIGVGCITWLRRRRIL